MRQHLKTNTSSNSWNTSYKGGQTIDQLPWDIRTYWMFRDDMAVINRVVIKGQCIVIPKALQQALKQLHINHMGIEKPKY